MATTDSTGEETSSDSGPFAGIPMFLWACVVLLIGAAVAFTAFTDSSGDLLFIALYISFYIVAAIGGLWFIDVILSYLKN